MRTDVCYDYTGQLSTGVNSLPMKAFLIFPHLSPVEFKDLVLAIVEEGNDYCSEKTCGDKAEASGHPHTPTSNYGTVT